MMFVKIGGERINMSRVALFKASYQYCAIEFYSDTLNDEGNLTMYHASCYDSLEEMKEDLDRLDSMVSVRDFNSKEEMEVITLSAN